MNDKDAISSELDRRKLQKLVDEGVITEEEIANANINYLKQVCRCENSVPTYHGYCNKCYTKYDELQVEGDTE